MSNASSEHFRIIASENVNIIEFTFPAQIEAIEFDVLNQQLADAVTARGESKWVVDLATVSYVGSALLGMLVNIRTRVRRSRGKMVLCHMDPLLERVLRTGSMDKLFTIVTTRQAALESL